MRCKLPSLFRKQQLQSSCARMLCSSRVFFNPAVPQGGQRDMRGVKNFVFVWREALWAPMRMWNNEANTKCAWVDFSNFKTAFSQTLGHNGTQSKNWVSFFHPIFFSHCCTFLYFQHNLAQKARQCRAKWLLTAAAQFKTSSERLQTFEKSKWTLCQLGKNQNSDSSSTKFPKRFH